jgi:membrane protein YqaA with SNARE-associated domain
MSSSEQPQSSDESVSIRKILSDTLVFTIVTVLLVALAGYLLRAPLQAMANQLVALFGYAGIFVGVFIADAFTFPLPPDVYLVIGIAANTDVFWTLVVCSFASVVGGQVAYFLGPHIRKIPVLNEKLEGYRAEGQYLFAEWGSWSVSIAALTPIPFSIVSWLAGIYQMDYGRYFIASLVRIPRLVGYYYLYASGWAPGVF